LGFKKILFPGFLERESRILVLRKETERGFIWLSCGDGERNFDFEFLF